MEEERQGLVDIKEVSKELMKSVLGTYVQFDPGQQEFLFTEDWQKLNNDLKILCHLIARKGMSAGGHLSDEEAVAPKAILEQTHLPSGSVSYTLKLLFDDKLIAKTGSGKYYVPSAKLLVVKGMLERAAKGESAKSVIRRRSKKRKTTESKVEEKQEQ